MAVVTVTNVAASPTGGATSATLSAAHAADPVDSRVVWGSVAAVAVAIAAMCILHRFVIHTKPFTIVNNYAPYAGVIAVAAALERLLEPLSEKWMQNPPGQGGNTPAPASQSGAKQVISKRQTMKQVAASSMMTAKIAAADPAQDSHTVQALVNTAAQAQAQVETLRTTRAVFFWAIASICGVVISGGFGIFLLQSIAKGSVSPYLDLAVTGLTIGAGTKPTHDLISSLQAKAGGS